MRYKLQELTLHTRLQELTLHTWLQELTLHTWLSLLCTPGYKNYKSLLCTPGWKLITSRKKHLMICKNVYKLL